MAPRQVASPTHLECTMSSLRKRATKPKKREQRERKRKKMERNTRVTIYTTTQTPPHVENMHNATKTHYHPAKINQQSTQCRIPLPKTQEGMGQYKKQTTTPYEIKHEEHPQIERVRVRAGWGYNSQSLGPVRPRWRPKMRWKW